MIHKDKDSGKSFSESASGDALAAGKDAGGVKTDDSEHRDAYGRNIKDWLLINGKYRPHP